MNGDRVWPGISKKEVAQVCPPPPPAFVWTLEAKHQPSMASLPSGYWGAWAGKSSPLPSLVAWPPGLEGRLLVKELGRQEEVGGRTYLSTGKESRTLVTAGGRGATEGGLPFGNRKTQTQTGAEGVRRDPSLNRDARTGLGGSRQTLKNLLSESH